MKMLLDFLIQNIDLIFEKEDLREICKRISQDIERLMILGDKKNLERLFCHSLIGI